MKNPVLAEKNEYLKSEFRRLKTLFQKLWRSPYSKFYRRKYERVDLRLNDIKRPEDWLKIPFLTRKDLEATDPWDRLYGPKEKVSAIRNTSGTTGKPIVFLRSEDIDILKYLKPYFHFHSLLCLTPYNRYYGMVPALAGMNVVVTAGDIHDMPRTALLTRKLDVDALLGSASIILAFYPYLREFISPEKIRFIMIRMEHVTKLEWENLKNFFPKAQIISVYSSVEGGFIEIDFACRETAKFYNRHHLASRSAFLEISKENEMILTTFFGALPLIRYRTGDLATFIPEPCACGLKDPLFAVWGRLNYDFLRIKGVEIRADDIEEAIKSILKIAKPEFKFHVIEESALVHRFVLEIANGKSLADFPSVSDRITQKIRVSPNLTLGDAIKNGLFKPLEIYFVSDFPIEQKKKRIVLQEA